MKLVGPFIDPETKKKIVYDRDMKECVPAKQLCKTFGGDLDFEYDHSVYWPAFNKLAEERRKSQFDRWVKGGKMIGELELYLRGAQETSIKDASTVDAGINKVTKKTTEAASLETEPSVPVAA